MSKPKSQKGRNMIHEEKDEHVVSVVRNMWVIALLELIVAIAVVKVDT